MAVLQIAKICFGTVERLTMNLQIKIALHLFQTLKVMTISVEPKGMHCARFQCVDEFKVNC